MRMLRNDWTESTADAQDLDGSLEEDWGEASIVRYFSRKKDDLHNKFHYGTSGSQRAHVHCVCHLCMSRPGTACALLRTLRNASNEVVGEASFCSCMPNLGCRISLALCVGSGILLHLDLSLRLVGRAATRLPRCQSFLTWCVTNP